MSWKDDQLGQDFGEYATLHFALVAEYEQAMLSYLWDDATRGEAQEACRVHRIGPQTYVYKHNRWLAERAMRGSFPDATSLARASCAAGDPIFPIRPYKEPWTIEDIVENLARDIYNHLDPDRRACVCRYCPEDVAWAIQELATRRKTSRRYLKMAERLMSRGIWPDDPELRPDENWWTEKMNPGRWTDRLMGENSSESP